MFSVRGFGNGEELEKVIPMSLLSSVCDISLPLQGVTSPFSLSGCDISLLSCRSQAAVEARISAEGLQWIAGILMCGKIGLPWKCKVRIA